MKLSDIIDIIVKIIVVITAIIAIYWAIQLLFGGSPTLNQFNSILVVMMIGILFNVVYKISNLNREIGEIKISMKHLSIGVKESFINIKKDIEFIKNKM